MKKKNVDNLYFTQESIGEVFIDDVISVLRKTQIVTGVDLAIFLAANPHELRYSWLPLTGTALPPQTIDESTYKVDSKFKNLF